MRAAVATLVILMAAAMVVGCRGVQDSGEARVRLEPVRPPTERQKEAEEMGRVIERLEGEYLELEKRLSSLMAEREKASGAEAADVQLEIGHVIALKRYKRDLIEQTRRLQIEAALGVVPLHAVPEGEGFRIVGGIPAASSATERDEGEK